MDGRNPSLNTRWSMLEGLSGRRAEETWRWFIDRYRPYIRTCLGRLIHPRERAERAAEEIWSYLFTSAVIENADRDRRFRTYLAGTVRNYAHAWLRRDAGVNGVDPPDATALEADPAQQIEREDLRLWKSQVVQLALEELGHRHGEQARALRWFYGLPDTMQDEVVEPRPASWIAEQLGIRANAVHQLVFRGRKRLRSCIENELRETVLDVDDLVSELRLIDRILEHENPGLEP